jgi:tetratricopeptide (TPR) repeat protein
LNTSLYQYPNSWPVRLALGSAYETQGNTVAAVREYQESIRIKPENPAAYLGIANVREIRGDVEHSIAELRSGLELMPNNPELRLRIGDESLKVAKLDDAIKEYEGVLSTNPGSSRAVEGLTNAYYLKAQKETTGGYFGDNDYDHAAQMIDRAIQMNPHDLKLRLAQAKLRALSGEQVDLSSVGTPTNDAERISYAQLALAQNHFQEASDQMHTVISHVNDAKQAFAVADMSLMLHDLDSAESAYKKGSTFLGASQRAQRGLAQVAKARQSAKKELTLATDFEKRKLTSSAIDAYHNAISSNPRVPEARLGLARTLDSLSKPTAPELRESAMQYRAYLSLTPNMPAKEQEKIARKAEKLEAKAFKVEQRPIQTARR